VKRLRLREWRQKRCTYEKRVIDDTHANTLYSDARCEVVELYSDARCEVVDQLSLGQLEAHQGNVAPVHGEEPYALLVHVEAPLLDDSGYGLHL